MSINPTASVSKVIYSLVIIICQSDMQTPIRMKTFENHNLDTNILFDDSSDEDEKVLEVEEHIAFVDEEK